MDEDDVGKQRIGVNLTIAAEFDSFAVTETTFLQAQLGSKYKSIPIIACLLVMLLKNWFTSKINLSGTKFFRT